MGNNPIYHIFEEIRTHEADAELQARRNHLLENVIETERDQYAADVIGLDGLVEAEMGLIHARVDHLETMRRLRRKTRMREGGWVWKSR